MIVIAIIGILAVIVVPTYTSLRKRAQATEARMMLSSLHKLQFAYHSEQDTYTTDMNDLGFSLFGDERYTYVVTAATTSSYSASASANLDRDPALDIWIVDESGAIQHIGED